MLEKSLKGSRGYWIWIIFLLADHRRSGFSAICNSWITAWVSRE